MAESTVTGHIGSTNFQVLLDDGKHTWLADEPESLGGGDRGPDPVSLLKSSLAACTSITLKMYAQRKGWPLADVRVSIAFESADGVSSFDRHIVLEGDLTDEQRERLLQIANACPVHKILTGTIAIRTGLTVA
jgi:putative redox protein